jgi:predicted RecB family endonuclease
MSNICTDNLDSMEKGELQRVCHELFKIFEELKNSSIEHLQRLKDFEIEKNCLIAKIKSLEDALMKSNIPLKNSPDSNLSFDKVSTSSSHALPTCKTMFVIGVCRTRGN